MYGRVVYPAVGWCTVCSGGGVLCGRAVHCVVECGVLGGRAVYCVVGRCTVWWSGVLCGRVLYCVLGWCIAVI